MCFRVVQSTTSDSRLPGEARARLETPRHHNPIINTRHSRADTRTGGALERRRRANDAAAACSERMAARARMLVAAARWRGPLPLPEAALESVPVASPTLNARSQNASNSLSESGRYRHEQMLDVRSMLRSTPSHPAAESVWVCEPLRELGDSSSPPRDRRAPKPRFGRRGHRGALVAPNGSTRRQLAAPQYASLGFVTTYEEKEVGVRRATNKFPQQFARAPCACARRSRRVSIITQVVTRHSSVERNHKAQSLRYATSRPFETARASALPAQLRQVAAAPGYRRQRTSRGPTAGRPRPPLCRGRRGREGWTP